MIVSQKYVHCNKLKPFTNCIKIQKDRKVLVARSLKSKLKSDLKLNLDIQFFSFLFYFMATKKFYKTWSTEEAGAITFCE